MCFCLFNLEGRDVAIKFILNSEKYIKSSLFFFLLNPNCLFGGDMGKEAVRSLQTSLTNSENIE